MCVSHVYEDEGDMWGVLVCSGKKDTTFLRACQEEKSGMYKNWRGKVGGGERALGARANEMLAGWELAIDTKIHPYTCCVTHTSLILTNSLNMVR